MIVYWDTSALVAVYCQDACTAQAQDLRARTTRPVSSWLCFAEAYAALRPHGGAKAAAAWRDFEDDWLAFQKIVVNERQTPELRRIFRFHALRGADGIHLAAALTVQRRLTAIGESLVFACHDRALARAARSEGLTLGWMP